MREVHRRLGGAKQDELMVNGEWSMFNGYTCLLTPPRSADSQRR